MDEGFGAWRGCAWSEQPGVPSLRALITLLLLASDN
jgi:hypothetical protein